MSKGKAPGKAQVKPNSKPPPGPIGNTNGMIVPDTAPNPGLNSAPAIKPTAKEKGWWDSWKDTVHTGLDIAGAIPVVGIFADGANAAIYTAEGDYDNAAISGVSAAANLIPGGGAVMKGGKLVVKGGQALLKAEVKQVAKQTAKEIAEAAAKKAAKEAEEAAAKKLAKEAEEAAAKKANKGKKGGKDKGNPRCILRPYKPDTCKPRTGHHVVPDRVFQVGGRKTGTRIPGGLSEANGLVICVDGATPKPTNEHGKIHRLYDAAERVIGRAGKTPGTADLLALEVAGAAAAARVTGCNAASLATQLRLYHQAQGMGEGFVVRADKMGTLANRVPFGTFGSNATPGAGTF